MFKLSVRVAYFIMFCVTCSFVSTSYANEASNQSKNDLKAILGQINTLSTDFSQQVYDADEVVYEASGKLYLARPGKVRWETSSPDEALMIADGNSIWNVDSFVEQITVFDQQSAISNNPIILLTTQDDSVWDEFKISTLNTAKSGDAKTGFKVDTLNANAQIQTLTIYTGNGSIEGIDTIDSQGQLSRLVFSNVKTNTGLKDDLFIVDLSENYTIDDQR